MCILVMLMALPTSDPGEHSKRRRLMGQLFNRSKMDNLEELMVRHVEELVGAVKHTTGSFDVMPACRALEADIICTLTLLFCFPTLNTDGGQRCFLSEPRSEQ